MHRAVLTHRFVLAHRCVLVLLAVLAVAAGCSPAGPQEGDGPAPSPPGPAATAGRPPSLAPPLDWHPCGQFECATLQVPLDAADLGGRQIGIALNRHRATDPGRRIGSLLVNPGGPGASGVDALPALLDRLSPQVQARFDVVGFDPRGVGRSSPVHCLPSAELAAYLSIDPAPDDLPEKAALLRSTEQFVAGCQERSGDLLPHVGTADAARDLDRIRIAVGDEKLTFVGFSYGTALGTSYAEQFPNRVRALLLDGAIDPSLDASALNRGQGEGFDRAFDAFLADCRRRPTCTWRPRGGATKSAFLAMANRVEDRPIAAGKRRVGPSELFLGVVAHLYSEKTWTALARGLAELEAGSGSVVLAGFDALTGRRPDGSFSNDQAANVAVNCLDRTAPRDPAAYERAAAEILSTAPAFGPPLAWSGLVCGLWPVPATGTPAPANAPGTPPILVVGTTNDPATPFVWSEALARQLPQGRLLRHDGEGHTAYGLDPCTSAIGDAYLLTLDLPLGRLTC